LPTEPLEKCREGQRHLDQDWRQLPANDRAVRLGLSRNLARVLLHPDVSGDGVFEREFDFVGEDDRHRPLLQDLERAGFGEAVGGELFALERVDFVAESGETDFLAGRDEGERQAGGLADFGFRGHGFTRRRAAAG